jgi:steroid delta-isomerase-like uncharacterized protein
MSSNSIAESGTDVVIRYYAAYNRRALDDAAALVADDVQWINIPLGVVHRGRDEFRGFLQNYAKAFPDSQVEVTRTFACGDQVAVEFTVHGTQSGPLEGAAATIPATGRSIDVQLCEIIEVRDGSIVSGRSYWDLATMMRQLGLLDPPA